MSTRPNCQRPRRDAGAEGRVDAREVARWAVVQARTFGQKPESAESSYMQEAADGGRCGPTATTLPPRLAAAPALLATILPDARTLDPYAVAAAFKEDEMNDGCPLFVELCAGTAAVSLRLHGGKHARPPVSRMGAKTGYADVILRVLGLRPGQGYADGTRYVWCEPDAGVRLLLEAYRDRELAQAAAEIIRSWKDEDPRALWERLRAEGPARHVCEAREVARWATIQAGSLGGCYGAGPTAFERFGHNPKTGQRFLGSPAHSVVAPALLRLASVSPATIHPDAREVEPPVPLPAGTVAYIDPPYLNTTGYADAFPREEWIPVVRRWDEAGATVCISEAEPIPELVADGWRAVEITGERRGQKRTFSKQKREWLTLNREPSWTPSEQVGLFGGFTEAETGRAT